MNIEEVITQLQQFKPVSVFLYGSRARTDFLPDSDHEIGVIFRADGYVSRGEIAEKVQFPDVNIYPFKLEDLEAGHLDTPFVVPIYLHELILSARTISGEEAVERLIPPSITTLHLLQEIRFGLGRATAALLSKRHGDDVSAALGFSKTCLFAVRCLVILRLRRFPTSYDEIYELADQVVDDESYRELVKAAYAVRKRELEVTNQHLFDNLAFLNRVVEPVLMEAYQKDGDSVVLTAEGSTR
jgi:hypothetical protein